MNYKVAKIRTLIQLGHTFEDIKKRFKKTNVNLIKRTYRELILKDVRGVSLGSKQSSYYTEEEMIRGYQIPSLDEVILEFKND